MIGRYFFSSNSSLPIYNFSPLVQTVNIIFDLMTITNEKQEIVGTLLYTNYNDTIIFMHYIIIHLF